MRAQHDDVDPDDPGDWKTFIEENRDQIEFEANADVPDAWVFQKLLDYYEEELS